MTDKEFKRLGRAQLMDIIYQLQLEVDKLKEENEQLEKALADKRFRIENAGSLAEAALEISGCFSRAQKAAELYLNEIKAVREEIETERTRILNEAQEEAAAIVEAAKTSPAEQDVQEQKDSDNG